MLNLWDREEVSLPNLSIRPLGGLDVHMPTDVLMLFASVSSQQLILSFFYSTELFKFTTIERMAKDMHSLLEVGFGLRTNADLGFTDGRSADGSSEGCRRGHFG